MPPRSSASPTALGSLEPGKDANLFIAKGDPLEIRTEVTHVFIAGNDVGLEQQTPGALREVHQPQVGTHDA